MEVAGKVLADQERTFDEREIAYKALCDGVFTPGCGPESVRALQAALEVERDPKMRQRIDDVLHRGDGE